MVAVPRGPVALALVLWALSAVRCASASVNELKRVPIAAAVPLADQWLLSEPVFAYDDRPGGAEQPFVHLDAVFSREVVGTAGYIEVLLYHSDDQKYIGMESNEDGVRGCCRRQLQPTPPTHSMPPRLSLTIFCCGFRRRPRRFCAARSAVLLQPIRPR